MLLDMSYKRTSWWVISYLNLHILETALPTLFHKEIAAKSMKYAYMPSCKLIHSRDFKTHSSVTCSSSDDHAVKLMIALPFTMLPVVDHEVWTLESQR